MRRTIWIATATAVTLCAAGIAIAATRDRGVQPVTATFTATTTEATKTRTCTSASGDTWHLTRGVYTGTATGDARLSGKITIRTHSAINVTTGFGYTHGVVVLREDDGDAKSKASLSAVNTNRGHLNGFLRGRVKASGDLRGGHLYANFEATFNAAGTALSGTLGAGSEPNSAVIFSGSGCKAGVSGERTKTAQYRIARGEITALSSTSITVDPDNGETLTCSIAAAQAERISKTRIAVGQRAKLTCVLREGTWRLFRLERERR